MRRLFTPQISGFVYLVMGILFIIFASQSAEVSGLWSFPTMLLVAIATFDLGLAVRLFFISFMIKRNSKK
ncbi:YdiK family protein [Bacillaceae bacterium SIJ1]|uniref:DUF4305 domain-containing protein n=1 Tax=Litoribacterium kuwaitense TaxID=1398745 RepID=UPI0013E9E29F|nr:DUF4305 domain-containing protein [Litoribacterium kuwaitense]NGP46556.1 YdiK family protein [Litoribacterium kuwaitense]